MATQFTLARLFTSITLAAVALALARRLWYGPNTERDFMVALIASSCAGAAVGILAKRLYLGWLFGIAAFVGLALGAAIVSG